MRFPTSQLPAVQFITIPPELEEPYNQEIFKEVVVRVTDVGQEERDVVEGWIYICVPRVEGCICTTCGVIYIQWRTVQY